MDLLIALSLAASVLQFVDFTYKLVSGSVEIYKSATGLTSENKFLEVIAEDVRQRNGHISDSLKSLGSSNAERRLHKLAARSSDIAQAILGIIKSLKCDNIKPSKWRSFVDLVRSGRKAGELRMLIDKSNKLLAQINTDLIYIIW